MFEQAYGSRGKAPGGSESRQVLNQTIHHALVSHGHGVRAVREHGGRGAVCGLSDNCETMIPVTESPDDIAAAREAFGDSNLAILDPISRGAYSTKYLRRCGANRPKVERGDFSLIGLPTDFLGLNIYAGLFVRMDREGRPQVLHPSASYPRTDSPWLHLAPRALYWAPRLAAEVFKVRNVYVTENGCGYDDDVVKGVNAWTSTGLNIFAATSRSSSGRSRTAHRFGAILCGVSSTTLSGPTAVPGGLESCTMISGPSAGRRS